MQPEPKPDPAATGPNYSKPIQANPSQTKKNQEKPRQKSLELLGFVRPNWDFSIGYGDPRAKIPFLPPRTRRHPRGRRSRTEPEATLACVSIFGKHLTALIALAVCRPQSLARLRSPVVMAERDPAIHAAPLQSLTKSRLFATAGLRALDAPDRVDGRRKGGHDALSPRRSSAPIVPFSADQQLTR